MRAVLGIDAAWTVTQPSGVALVVESAGGWNLVAAESSYQRFHALGNPEIPRQTRPAGSIPSASALLKSSQAIGGIEIDLVAIDMPLSIAPIIGRRECDNAVSRAYGNRKCSTHSPSRERPGRLSDVLREEFETAGYPLLTTSNNAKGLVEVYPHPALVELAKAKERLPYKAAKARNYWPALSPEQRRLELFEQWSVIVAALDHEIAGVAELFPRPDLSASGSKLKAYEDALDAVICAWVGICVLEGRAMPFGDETSAIWIPRATQEGVD